MNKVILIGRLGRDPETKYVSGKAVANFSMATDESYKDKNGERKKRTEWHKIVAWGKQAEIVHKFLKKGSLLAIEGKLQTRSWDKDGEKRYSTEVVCDRLSMLDGKPQSGEKASETKQAGEPVEITDDDIPF